MIKIFWIMRTDKRRVKIYLQTVFFCRVLQINRLRR